MYIGSTLHPNRKVQKQKKLNIKINPIDFVIAFFGLMVVGIGSYFVFTLTKNMPSNAQVAGVQTNTYVQTNGSQKNLIETITSNNKYKYFYDALTKSGVVDTLKSDKSYTVLVPNDAAFEKLGEKLNLLLQNSSNINELTKLVKNHIIEGSISSEGLSNASTVTNLNKVSLEIEKDDYSLKIGGAQVNVSNIGASNGLVYEIDTVLQ